MAYASTSARSAQSSTFIDRSSLLGRVVRRALRLVRRRSPPGPKHVVGKRPAVLAVPGTGPADVVEQARDDARGEPPQDQVLVGTDEEARAEPAGRVPDRDPVL